jgi:glycosyltransferase involved in cell wall biosynthesis
MADSNSTARDVQDLFGVPSERILVVPLGVASRFKPLPREDTEHFRLAHRLPDRFVLFVGAVEPRKNLETLLDAWAMLKSRPPLVVAGTWGWRYEPVKQRIERLGPGVQLLRAVDSSTLPRLYNLATCLAHPAWYEGFGLTPLEAMACGTPVIASNSSSIPEVVGDAGLLVAPDDVEGWRRGLERLLEDADLRAELRRKGLVRAAEFGWDRTAEATWELIEALAGRS